MTTTMALKINSRVRQMVGSTTLAITARAKELAAQGKDVVNFAAGEPDFDTPEPIKAAGIKAIQKGFTKYTPSTGIVELKQAIVAKFQRDNQLTYKPSQIVVGCGAKHVIYNVIQVLADEGEEVLIPAPYWVSYPEMVKASGATIKILPTTPESCFKITASQLASSLSDRTKILILNSPSNPTGMIYSRQELEAIAKVCVDKNIYVISDDIYEKLTYVPEPYTSIAALNPDIYRLTITVNGVSKAYAMTGWRIGYCAGPEEIMEYVKNFQDHTTSNPTSISQYAALQALQEPEDAVKGMCQIFKERRDLMASLLDNVPKLKYYLPDGAFYIFCDISFAGSGDQVAKDILNDVNVAVIPGEGFGAPGFIRLSFSTSNERIKEGIGRIADWLKKKS